MKISMYEASIPVFVHTLGNLNSILQKGVQYAEARKFDPNNLAATRLFPDMLPLTRQVQIASDTAKFAASRLSGTEAPKFEDNETTIAELIARVDKTLDYLKGFRPDQFEGAEDRTVVIKTSRGEYTFTGLVYLRHWAIPNFFFHATTTYALLRHSGVELGKTDFLGKVQA
jgi:uncharacterized protein